jgi:hypothetical protein
MTVSVVEKTCSKCGIPKPLETGFYRNRARPDGRTMRCRECELAAVTAWRAANQEKVRASEAAYRRNNRAAQVAAVAAWRKANPGKHAAHEAARNARLKARVLSHYGLICACCGTTEDLSIDHINGRGREHRDKLFGTQQVAYRFYAWLIRQGFPDGYQTLCRPCNSSKRRGTHCRLTHTQPDTGEK